MDDVAHACGISKKTLYNHYDNKAMLVSASIENKLTTICKHYTAVQKVAENAIDEIFKGVANIELFFSVISYHMLEELEKYYRELWDATQQSMQATGKDVTIKNLQRGQAEGLYHLCFDSEMTTRMRMLLFTAMHKESKYIDNLHSFLMQVNKHYLSGLCTAKGIKELKKYHSINNNDQ